MNWWWLSFAGEEGFRGVAIVGPADDILSAVRICYSLGINPGGEVAAFTVPEGALPHIPAADRHRLLTEFEARELDRQVGEAAKRAMS
jgi:hypothetical protein